MNKNNDYSLIVLAGIIGTLMVVFLIYSITVSIFEKRRHKQEQAENAGVASRIMLESRLILQHILKLNSEALAKFVPSIGDIKMSQIQAAAKRVLEYYFIHNRYFLSFIILQEIFTEIRELIHALHNENSNNWERRLGEKLGLISNSGDKEHHTLRKIINEEVERIYRMVA